MVKIHFLQKVLKKWSSFRKKNKKNFSITGGGARTLYGIFHNFFFFFFNPSLKESKDIFFKLCNFLILHEFEMNRSAFSLKYLKKRRVKGAEGNMYTHSILK